MNDFISFERAADYYDLTRVIPDETLDDISRLCLSAARADAESWFLDAGVGTGRFAIPLARQSPGRVVGIDIALPMMKRAKEKGLLLAKPPVLVRGDLLRLPFRTGMFQAVLMVHILHLISNWASVVGEAQRVLAPGGTLLIGLEEGGHSKIVDYYIGRGRSQGVIGARVGAERIATVLHHIRRTGRNRAKIERLSAPYLQWNRAQRVADTLALLDQRPYSTMWGVPDAVHAQLMRDTAMYADQVYGGPDGMETVQKTFALHAVRWERN